MEALNVDRKSTDKIICKLWRKRSEMKYILRDWATEVLVPIYKKGDRFEPSSYLPIALLSHNRKVIEAAMERLIRKNYTFNECQLGFRHGTGTEIAIVRHISNAESMETAAVLDLNSAYDMIPRKKLLQVMASSVNANVLNMIRLMLQTVHIRTQGED